MLSILVYHDSNQMKKSCMKEYTDLKDVKEMLDRNYLIFFNRKENT